MKTVFFSTKSYEREPLARTNKKAGHDLTFFDEPLNADTVNLAVGASAVSILMHDKVDQHLLSELSKMGIRVVALRCAGFDNIDRVAAVKENITIMRVPAYSPEAVAEHAAALILTLSRKIHIAYTRTRNNNFSLTGLMGFNLHGKTVGVIGTGHIGTAFCKIMLGFGCKVLAYDIIPSKLLEESGVQYATFQKLLRGADIVSIHCPLTAETRHLIDESALSILKKGAMLINTGRGAILDTTAVISALKSGRLGALGIDVYEAEEGLFFKDLSGTVVNDDLIERLLTFPNVLVTPHQAFFTTEAVEEICATTIQNLSDFENGISSGNEV